MLGWELPPQNSGGLGVACYQLCKNLTSRNVDVEFVLPYEATDKPAFMKVTSALPPGVAHIVATGNAYDSYKYEYIDGSIKWHDIYSQQAGYERAVAKLAEETEFDIIHAHDWLTFRGALRIKLRSNCPLIVHVHSIEADRAGGESGNPLVREIESTTFLAADKILAVSSLTKSKIHQEYQIPLEKIEVVHNSIDSSSLVPLNGENSYRYLNALKSQGYTIISNIGRLTIQKGLPNLLRAAQIVLQKNPKTIFFIVGAGEQYEELIDLSGELGISRSVIFAGFQRGKPWRDAFSIADLFVMPSLSEPFGLTPLEAAYYGTASLISKQSGVAEVIANALKVDFWDIDEMANQILACCRNRDLTDTISQNASLEIEKLSWAKAVDKICTIYDEHLVKVEQAVL